MLGTSHEIYSNVGQCHKPAIWVDGWNATHKNGKIVVRITVALLTLEPRDGQKPDVGIH